MAREDTNKIFRSSLECEDEVKRARQDFDKSRGAGPEAQSLFEGLRAAIPPAFVSAPEYVQITGLFQKLFDDMQEAQKAKEEEPPSKKMRADALDTEAGAEKDKKDVDMQKDNDGDDDSNGHVDSKPSGHASAKQSKQSEIMAIREKGRIAVKADADKIAQEFRAGKDAAAGL